MMLGGDKTIGPAAERRVMTIRMREEGGCERQVGGEYILMLVVR